MEHVIKSNIVFNITNDWFYKNHEDPSSMLPKFMETNSKIPYGEERNKAYVELILEELKKAGLYDRYLLETTELITETTRLTVDYIGFKETLDKLDPIIMEEISNVSRTSSASALRKHIEGIKALATALGNNT